MTSASVKSGSSLFERQVGMGLQVVVDEDVAFDQSVLSAQARSSERVGGG
jgi:hypothetical protein